MKMIENLLQEKNCFIKKGVNSWREAVQLACEPLIEQNYCTEEYVEAVYELTDQFGPYYVLCENLALIHASSHKGVNDTQMAVTVLDEPVKFKPEGWDVRVLVTLVAKDCDSHMEGLKALCNIFSDESKVHQILQVKHPKDIYDLFVSNAG